MNRKGRRIGKPEDNDIENPDEVPVSPDGMNEDSSGTGTCTNTSTKTERHFSNKVVPLTGINIPPLPSLKDRTIQSKFRSFKNTMLEIFEGPFQDCNNKTKASYLRIWLSKQARYMLMGIKTWGTLDRNNSYYILQTLQQRIRPNQSDWNTARYKIWYIKQQKNEPIDLCISRIDTLISDCMYPTQERRDEELIAAVKYGLNDKDVQAKLHSKPMETTAEEIIEYMHKKEIGKREASIVNYLKHKHKKTSQPASSQVLKEVRGAKKGRGYGKSSKHSQQAKQVTNCTKCARSHEHGNCYTYGKNCKLWQAKSLARMLLG